MKTTTLVKDNSDNVVWKDSLALMKKDGYSESEMVRFTREADAVLDVCRNHFGPEIEVRYTVQRRSGRVALYMLIEGEHYNPLVDRQNEEVGMFEFLMRLFLPKRMANSAYSYLMGYNIISIYSSEKEKKEFSLRSPLFIALIMGVVCGIICQLLPKHIADFLVNDLSKPLASLVLELMTGIMGPVIFLSMITSISSLENVSRLTNLGFKIIKRFFKITMFLILVSIGVSMLFYSVFGEGSVNFEPKLLVDMIIKLFPTNIIRAFSDNNIPQLVVFGFTMGVALLILGDKADPLTPIIRSFQDWFITAMELIYTMVPLVPFFSVFQIIAGGNIKTFLNAWEFIVAVVLSSVFCCACKLIKTSIRCKIGIPTLWKKIRNLVITAFSTGSEAATMKIQIEQSKTVMGIDPDFSDFWIPLSQAMLRPRTTIHLVIPVFLIAKYTGIPISQGLIMALIIMVVELSFASAGITSAWMILFATFHFPMEYVGLFVIYKAFTTNFGAAASVFYYALEQIEAAHALKALDKSYYQSENSLSQ